MSFMDRARAEAERGVAERREALWENDVELPDYSWSRAYREGFTEGAAWAVEQKPTDDEVMEAARVIVPTLDVWGRAWGEASAQARSRAIPLARSALAAAQKVRVGL